MNKTQFMVMMDVEEATRVDRLRIVMGLSRAEVVCRACSDAFGPLGRMEGMYAERLGRLTTLAEREVGRGKWREWVQKMVKGRKTLPSLEVLEALSEEARRTK